MSFEEKYLKYKQKYLDLKNMEGGLPRSTKKVSSKSSSRSASPTNVVLGNPNETIKARAAMLEKIYTELSNAKKEVNQRSKNTIQSKNEKAFVDFYNSENRYNVLLESKKALLKNLVSESLARVKQAKSVGKKETLLARKEYVMAKVTHLAFVQTYKKLELEDLKNKVSDVDRDIKSLEKDRKKYEDKLQIIYTRESKGDYNSVSSSDEE